MGETIAPKKMKLQLVFTAWALHRLELGKTEVDQTRKKPVNF